MRKSVFSQWFVGLLLGSTLGWWASVSIWAAAMDKGLNVPAPSNDPTAIAAIKQVEQDIGDAMVARDIEKLNQFYGGDWAAIGYSGKVIDKQTLLSDFKSSHVTLESFEIRPMDVQVFGNVAVAHAGVTEKRSRDGKDTSGEFVFMDLLEKRAGKWVVVRTAGARVVGADSTKAPSNDPTAIAAIRQVGRDMGDAMVAGNIDKLNQIYGDDWATVGSSGKIFIKENLLDDFKSGKHRLTSFELGPIDVQVFGDVAVAHGGVTEKRSDSGKDTSGELVYMDLLNKRAGKWVVVRSAGARVK
jgi:ketosteroid isomerase-like protein